MATQLHTPTSAQRRPRQWQGAKRFKPAQNRLPYIMFFSFLALFPLRAPEVNVLVRWRELLA